MNGKPGVLGTLEACGAYVDDAASFPEQFKPGVVKRHQREYAEARATVERLAEAAELALEMRWLGDDKPESSPVYRALTAALAAFRGDA